MTGPHTSSSSTGNQASQPEEYFASRVDLRTGKLKRKNPENQHNIIMQRDCRPVGSKTSFWETRVNFKEKKLTKKNPKQRDRRPDESNTSFWETRVNFKEKKLTKKNPKHGSAAPSSMNQPRQRTHTDMAIRKSAKSSSRQHEPLSTISIAASSSEKLGSNGKNKLSNQSVESINNRCQVNPSSVKTPAALPKPPVRISRFAELMSEPEIVPPDAKLVNERSGEVPTVIPYKKTPVNVFTKLFSRLFAKF